MPLPVCKGFFGQKIMDIKELGALVLSHFSQLHEWQAIPALLAPLADRVAGELWAWPTRPDQCAVRVSGGEP